MWQPIGDFFSGLWNGVVGIFRGAVKAIEGLIPNWLKDLISIGVGVATLLSPATAMAAAAHAAAAHPPPAVHAPAHTPPRALPARALSPKAIGLGQHAPANVAAAVIAAQAYGSVKAELTGHADVNIRIDQDGNARLKSLKAVGPLRAHVARGVFQA